MDGDALQRIEIGLPRFLGQRSPRMSLGSLAGTGQ